METENKQIGGCMAGFFNIFDRPHILSPKRLSSSSQTLQSAAESEPICSPLISKKQPISLYSTPELRSPAPEQNLTRSPLTLPVMESRSPWRFSKEAPRLSLDSRAVVDAKGTLKPRQIRAEAPTNRGGGSSSPSVIARLMGLEPLPLQRSASESRVNRFVDSFSFQMNPECSVEKPTIVAQDPAARSTRAKPARAQPPAPAPQRCQVRRKSYFDSTDFFPEAKKCDVEKTSDLETLKQLLEALRLKGLLHSSNKHQSNSNLVFESPVRSRASYARDQCKGRPQQKQQRQVSPLPWRSPEPRRRDCSEDEVKAKQQRRVSPLRHDCSRIGSQEVKAKVQNEYNRQGKTLLERCDKLLHSIAEMAADSQPSPVSVLDHHDDDSSPSPVMKRCLYFGAESEDESWGGSSDSEYLYISDIIRVSDCLPQDSDVFSLLEKQQYLKGKCLSRGATLERRLIFDAVQEIVGRRRRLLPWRMVGDEMQVIWSEFHKLRQKCPATEEEDLVGYVFRVLERDLSEDQWRDCPVEMSEAVLDIERLIFKDLIGETIRHLTSLNTSRRRLVF